MEYRNILVKTTTNIDSYLSGVNGNSIVILNLVLIIKNYWNKSISAGIKVFSAGEIG